MNTLNDTDLITVIDSLIQSASLDDIRNFLDQQREVLKLKGIPETIVQGPLRRLMTEVEMQKATIAMHETSIYQLQFDLRNAIKLLLSQYDAQTLLAANLGQYRY